MLKTKELEIINEESNARPNRIVAATMLILAIACAITFALNIAGVFHIKNIHSYIGFSVPLALLLLPQFIAYRKEIMCKKPVKYVFMGLFLIALLIILTFLNFHAQILLILPIVLASFYVSRKQTVIAYLGTVLVIILYIVFATLFKTWDLDLCTWLLNGYGYTVTAPLELGAGEIGKMLLYIGVPEFVTISAIEITVFKNIMYGKVRLDNQLKIQNLSTTDTLTGTLNRNSYENTLEVLRKEPHMGIICVYADANGLHELNNTKGHAAGDEMIVNLAEMFKHEYGQDNVYRTGGDEFVAFVTNETWSQAKVRAVYIKDMSEAKGYPVSIGLSQMKPNMTIDDVIKEAEKNMFSDKSNYYIKNHIDRRRGNTTYK